MTHRRSLDLPALYDQLAKEYARRSRAELYGKPGDRKILQRFASLVRGTVCDLGCGPGHVARFLDQLGVSVVGVDVSAGMLRQAEQLSPKIPFFQADMRRLPVEAESWGGIVGFYSLCHVPRTEVRPVVRELNRVLKPGGVLLLAYHLGIGTYMREQAWDPSQVLATTLFRTSELSGWLKEAGFTVMASLERPPYVGMESSHFKGYLLTRKTGQPTAPSYPANFLETVLSGTLEDLNGRIQAGAPLNRLDEEGMTSLGAAACEGRLEMVNALLEAGALAESLFPQGGSALHGAAFFGHLETAERLLRTGLSAELADRFGNTPFHAACAGNQLRLAKWLSTLKVDLETVNHQGQSPYACALWNGSQVVARWLEKTRTSAL